MTRAVAVVFLAALLLAAAGVVLLRKPAPLPATASALYAGATNVSAGSRLGNGTLEFPFVDLAALHITNMPLSGRVGLFVLTNGTRNDVFFDLERIELWQGGQWVERASEWPGFSWYLEPGKSSVQPVPEPAGTLPWRIRLGIQEYPRGFRRMLNETAAQVAHKAFFPRRHYQIFSPTIVNERAEPGGAADRSQPARPETSRARVAAGSGG